MQVLNTPNLDFDIHQMALSPHGKLLAVAGAFQAAVVVLPRAGFTKSVPTTVDCKYVSYLYPWLKMHLTSLCYEGPYRLVRTTMLPTLLHP